MGSDFNQNSDNDIPDWLKGISGGSEDADIDPGDLQPADSSNKEDVPDWLKNIRSSEDDEDGPTFMDEEVPEDDTDEWLESIRKRHEAETENLKRQKPAEEDSNDYLEKIRKLKESEQREQTIKSEEDDSISSSPETAHEPPDESPPAWESDADAPQEEDEDVPDWLSGLPTLDPVDESPGTNQQRETGEDTVPDWLQEMDQQSTEADKSAAEDETQPEDDGLPHVAPLSDPQPTTSSLPSWLENLQTSGLILPEDERDDQDDTGEDGIDSFDYSDEDVSSLLSEADNLPDWLGEDVTHAEDEEDDEEDREPSSAFPRQSQDEDKTAATSDEDVEIEKAELPTWLQAMRPVEAVTSASEIEDQDTSPREQEKVGPLSGLSDVLPAEPHIVHFGSQPTPTPGFTLTDTQKRYAELLTTLVEEESKSPPAKKRVVALPQQILRWVIGIVLVSVLAFVLWFRMDIFGLPSAGFPQETTAVINTINTLSAGQRVLVAFEYQPALSGEMESVSTGIIKHLLARQVDLVLFSTQPTGPGLAEALLQQGYLDSDYVRSQQYTNLGYLSGGSAALLNFAAHPQRAMPLQDAAGANLWEQQPLAGIRTIKDFSLVLVITDDPDMARSWVEQVQPVLDPAGDGSGTPLVMALSAQAEPLVHPYYLTSPRQVAGYVSGLSGGAFYETYSNAPVGAHPYWNAYNVGLLLAVFIITLGAVYNLVQKTFISTDREKA